MNTHTNLRAIRKGAGFTLVELLVVITIIAILAAVSIAGMNPLIINAQQSRALQQARSIGFALRSFASDHNGFFPRNRNSYGEDIVTSNDAFRSLMPTYVDDETVFTVPRSPVGPAADNRIDTPAEILEPGENHYAYIEGLQSTSNSNWPLIVDGTDGQGKYTTMEHEPGGVWRGGKAIVITVGNTAQAVPLQGPNDARFIPRYNDPEKDALALSEYMGNVVRLLEPAAPQ